MSRPENAKFRPRQNVRVRKGIDPSIPYGTGKIVEWLGPPQPGLPDLYRVRLDQGGLVYVNEHRIEKR